MDQAQDYEALSKTMKAFNFQFEEKRKKHKKHPWTEEEDLLIIQLVKEYGPQKWSLIAEKLPGRVGKQCRERWLNHLDPGICKKDWSEEEEWLLFLAHELFGNKWAYIAQILNGRSDNNIKNHWNSAMKKKLRGFIEKLQRIRENKSNLSEISSSKKEMNLLEKVLDMHDNDQPMESLGIDLGIYRKKQHSEINNSRSNDKILVNSKLMNKKPQKIFENASNKNFDYVDGFFRQEKKIKTMPDINNENNFYNEFFTNPNLLKNFHENNDEINEINNEDFFLKNPGSHLFMAKENLSPNSNAFLFNDMSENLMDSLKKKIRMSPRKLSYSPSSNNN